jgi:hypothetical protein
LTGNYWAGRRRRDGERRQRRSPGREHRKRVHGPHDHLLERRSSGRRRTRCRRRSGGTSGAKSTTADGGLDGKRSWWSVRSSAQASPLMLCLAHVADRHLRWLAGQGSNLEPPDPKSGVLPVELPAKRHHPPPRRGHRARDAIRPTPAATASLLGDMGSLIKKRRKRMRKKKHKKMLKATRWQRRAGK